jgi:hypothetical protein
MLRTARLLPHKGFRHWASPPQVSPRQRQSATGPPDSYPDRTYTGKRRRARPAINRSHDQPPVSGRTAEEVERRVLMRAVPSGHLAVHDPRFGWMQPQPAALSQPRRYGVSQPTGLLFRPGDGGTSVAFTAGGKTQPPRANTPHILMAKCSPSMSNKCPDPKSLACRLETLPASAARNHLCVRAALDLQMAWSTHLLYL